jgi:hypothetical protein
MPIGLASITLISVAILAISFTPNAYAEETVPAVAAALPTVSQIPNESSHGSNLSPEFAVPRDGFFDEFSLSAARESYLNRDKPPAGYTDYTLLSTRVFFQTHGTNFHGALDLGGITSTDAENYFNAELPEAYFTGENTFDGGGSPYRLAVTAGRKKYRWSALDSDWMLGIVQPFNRFDGLRPNEQGLTGVFTEFDRGMIHLLVFGSPIYIPEQGATYKLEDDRFTTSNPWFDKPPERMVFQNSAELDVRYTVNVPKIGDIVFHPSLGALVRLNDESGEGAFFQIGGMNKPRNQISLPFNGKLCLNNPASYGCVDVQPDITYHTIGFSEAGYNGKEFSAGVGALYETAAQPVEENQWNYQKLKPMLMGDVYAETRTFPSTSWGPRVRVAYLQTSGGETESSGPLAGNGSVLGPRTLFKNASSLTAQGLVFRSGRLAVDYGVRWIEEFAESGTIVMTDFGFRYGPNWQATFLFDLLGSQKDADDTTTFISRFRGNDRASIKVTYLF